MSAFIENMAASLQVTAEELLQAYCTFCSDFAEEVSK